MVSPSAGVGSRPVAATDALVAARLRAAGLRVTAPRLAVYAAVADRPHVDADRVAGAVRAALGSLSTQAVYDVLRVLTEQRLLRRIEPAGSAARYETRVGDNHHHLVCRCCGATSDVDCAVGGAPCLEPSPSPDRSGFVVDEAEVVFWGTCLACQPTGHSTHDHSLADHSTHDHPSPRNHEEPA